MRILCLGDSIMQYNDWTTYPQTGWVQLLDRFFVQGTQILNFARNGRSTKSFIAEGRFDKVLENSSCGDFALIQFGHNDEKTQDKTRGTSPSPNGEFRKNLIFMSESLIKRGIKPILLTPVVRRKFLLDNKIEDSHGEYTNAIRQTAASLKIPCIDITVLSTAYFEKIGKDSSRRFFMNFESGIYENYPDGKNDDSHLRPDGGYVICRLFVSALLKEKSNWPEYDAMIDSICAKGIYSDEEIDDEKLMW